MVLCFSYYYVVAAKHAWPTARVYFLPGGVMWDWFNDLTAHRNIAVRAMLRPKRRLSVWAENRAVRLADKIYVESNWLKKRLAEYYAGAEEKTCILPAPVDTNRFRPSAEHRAAIRAELGIGADTNVILALGRLDARKNYGVLLHAVAQLSTADWILLFAGSGPQAQELRDLGHSLGIDAKVMFVGSRTDPERLCASADLYCQPSLWESYSNALQEALASGLPCIISDRSVNTDLTDRMNVLLANPLEPLAWAQRIEMLLGNHHLAHNLGANARSFAESRPTWSDLADWLLDAFAGGTPPE
jgi:glycosyltransferase involved in cell wall biosynthesis